MRLHTPEPTSATLTSMSTSALPETPRRSRSTVVPYSTSCNNALIDSPQCSPPTSSQSPRIKTVTTTTRTRYTPHGVETETTVHTVTTYDESPPSPSPGPLPRPSLGPLPGPSPPFSTSRFSKPLVLQQNIPTIRVYLAPHPSTLTPTYIDKLYVVTGAEEVGIFNEWKDVLERTTRLGWRIFETRSNWREALDLYTIAYNEGTILIEPVPGGPFVDAPHVDVPLPPSVDNLPLNTSYPAPHEIERPANTQKFYVVTKGEEAGIFPTWHQAGARTQMMRSRASWHKYDTWQEALSVYTTAFNTGTIEVFPRPGGPFDKRASPGRGEISSNADPF